MTSPDIHALTGAYALDAVAGVERADFEQHLAECESCAQEVQELQETAARLALAAAEVPPPDLKDRVLAQIREVRQLSPDTTVVPLRRRSLAQRLTTVAAAVFFVAAAGLGVVVVRQDNQLDAARAQATQLEQILKAPDAELLTLDGSGGATGSMKVAVSRQQDKMLLLSGNLATAPDGRDYQLWTLADGRPSSRGLLEPAGGNLTYEVGDLGDADVVAITVEPAGGSRQPTEQPAMFAELPSD
ncbi:anti-sigma factor [Actinophytocola sp.]|uniref:anti-sigma factor n=1 Tax=Actinophytocola sp. TaxID=1872138 RepID=UPI002D60FB0E|nr:anti-sigma factor [Actinophytocola sp.]HYQ67041.1 anti-sigma factor [Actinophytocola sp.]